MMARLLFTNVLAFLYIIANGQNHVAGSTEWVNAGSISFLSSGAQPWTTLRSSAPGYFSALQGAVYTSSSDAAHVNGYIKKYGNEAFTFPIGSGSDLRTLSISAPSSSSDQYAAAWIAGDPNTIADPTAPGSGLHPRTALGSGLLSVSSSGQWDWQAISGTGAGLSITVSIPDMTIFSAAPANLRLAGWNGSQWINLSGSSGASGLSENSTLTGTMQSGISALSIASTSYALPLLLTQFDITVQNCDAMAKWRSENEVNTSHFEIEKSEDGRTFRTVGRVEAQGWAQTALYNYKLENTSAYYRLKMIDRDGKFVYSQVRFFNSPCRENKSIQLTPNPVNQASIAKLSFTTGYTGSGTIIISAQSGQHLWEKTIQIQTSHVTEDIPTANLRPGIYYLQVTDAAGKLLHKAVKFIKY